jgi:hypothetical protein
MVVGISAKNLLLTVRRATVSDDSFSCRLYSGNSFERWIVLHHGYRQFHDAVVGELMLPAPVSLGRSASAP